MPNEDETEVRPLEHIFDEESSNIIRRSPKEVSDSETQDQSSNEILYDFEMNPISFDSN